MTFYSTNLLNVPMEKMNFILNDDYKSKLLTPLKIKGRPYTSSKKARLEGCGKVRQKRRRIQYISPLEILYEQNILSIEQFNAGQTYAYLVRYIRANILSPQLARVKYQEKIGGGKWEEENEEEDRLKSFLTLWRNSILNLKKRGIVPKMLLGGFIECSPYEIEFMSTQEIFELQQSLNYLACFYKKYNKQYERSLNEKK